MDKDFVMAGGDDPDGCPDEVPVHNDPRDIIKVECFTVHRNQVLVPPLVFDELVVDDNYIWGKGVIVVFQYSK